MSEEAREVGDRYFVKASVGDVGLAVYPGQSPAEVLAVAKIIEHEFEENVCAIGPYFAREMARKVNKGSPPQGAGYSEKRR